MNFVWRLCLCLLYLYGRDESLLCYSTKLSCERRPEAATARHQAVTPPLPPAGLFPGRRRRAFFVVYVRCGGVGRARAAVRWRVTPHPSDQYTTRDSPVERPASSTERGAPPSLCWRAQPALARRCLGNIGILCPRRAHCVVSCRGRAVVPARLWGWASPPWPRRRSRLGSAACSDPHTNVLTAERNYMETIEKRI